ncbi:MAG: 2OG-Fe(II) oxygenase, partial [Mycobacteriales bacterium]
MTMPATPRGRLADVLGGLTTHAAFCAQRNASVDDLHLEVRDVGQLAFPVSDEQALALCQLGLAARYGRGERTLLDRRVRDTWEIPKSRVKIDRRRWNNTLVSTLAQLRDDLGLPPTCVLEPELHSLLVYGPGQFFVPHQDSEKTDAMVGSLVVTLPSAFTGGTLVIRHRNETASCRSSRKYASFVAFYADCRHEIRPVKAGYRVVLTYNLSLRGDSTAETDAPDADVDAIVPLLDEHFTTPAPPPRFGGSTEGRRPDRLVYLLDHEYTAAGLSWARLKGSDAKRAAVLRAAAERADCEIVLALADIHETWSAYESEPSGRYGERRYGGRYGGDDEEEDEDAGDDSTALDDYELGELIEDRITLERWLDPSGEETEPIATHVLDDEVCATTASGELQPYSSEYEGYMGNWGNTLDRWYRRAALVLWPRQRTFVVRAEASPAWALDALAARVRAQEVGLARDMASLLAPFWDSVIGREPRRGLLTKALRVARGLDDADLAALVLKPFRLELLTPGHAPVLAALVKGYGEDWTRALLLGWFGDRRRLTIHDRLAWVASLVGLGEALHAAGEPGTSVARLVVQESWTWLGGEIRTRLAIVAPARREEALTELAAAVLAVLDTAAVIAAYDIRDAASNLFRQQGDPLLGCLLRVLRSAEGISRP